MADLAKLFADAVDNGTFLSLVLSKRNKRADLDFQKIKVRPVQVKGASRFQFAFQKDRQETHENLEASEAIRRIGDQYASCFRHGHLYTTEADYTARLQEDGSFKVKSGPPSKKSVVRDHNRQKAYLIPENVPCAFLQEIEVMTSSGKVRAKRFDKFRQINRFLELVDDVVPQLRGNDPLQVIDFGCGKSYLTFALHHLLTVIHGRDVRIVGLDRNSDVVARCTDIASRLDCRGLEFRVGDIVDLEERGEIDLAVSLHACDTATDDAIAQAVHRKSDVILAVPCCQHEIAGKMDAPSLQPMAQHGILKERFAALATDTLRTQLLEICGYKTQVVEFIDMEHTAKNLLIRAVRRNLESNENDPEKVNSYRKFKQTLGLDRIYLEEVLADELENRLHQ